MTRAELRVSMDGVLLIDKPTGPTSHDVVARLRRSSGERRIGHTGTLDPLASGLLPLVVGCATRLASALSGSDKTYEAAIRFGVATDTDDAAGRPLGAVSTALPDDAEIDRALDRFRGTFDQMPPQHSAKKIGGRKAYDLARRNHIVDLRVVPVTVRMLERIGREADDVVVIRLRASAGFYVRALARDVGRAIGCSAHIARLRRTAVGAFEITSALPLAQAEQLGVEVSGRLIPPADALPDLPGVQVTGPGLARVVHGNPIGPEHIVGGGCGPTDRPRRLVRILAADGRLLALAEPRGGALHPVVVLG